MQIQAELFHDDIYQAARTVVMAMGGTKKVSGLFWPEKSVSQASELLNNCLNTARQEKLDPEQLLFLMINGQRIGCHAIVDFIGQQAGYKFMAIKPDDEKQELQKLVVKATQDLSCFITRLEELKHV